MQALRVAESQSVEPITVPGAQVLQLLELLAHWQIDAEQLLGPVGLSARELEEPNARLPITTMDGLLARARSLTGEPALGVFLGLRRRISLYGFLGFAAMSAATLREALELGVRFSVVVSTAIRLYLDVEGDVAALRVEECTDSGSVKDVVHTMFMVGLSQIGNALTGRNLQGHCDYSIPRPTYCDRFPELFASARFDQPVMQFIFAADMLDLPLVTPDRAGLRLARQQCERALCDLGLDGALLERVRRLIATDDGFRTLGEVAACLHLSGRTLKRRLHAQGSNFSELVEEERCHRARLLLRSSQLSLEDITERLGYSSVPNFSRAFRRWIGQSPASFRRAGTLNDVTLRVRTNPNASARVARR